MDKVIPRKVQFIGIASVKCNKSKPNQPVIGPGRIGKKEPTIPTNVSIKPSIKKKISMILFINMTYKLYYCYNIF